MPLSCHLCKPINRQTFLPGTNPHRCPAMRGPGTTCPLYVQVLEHSGVLFISNYVWSSLSGHSIGRSYWGARREGEVGPGRTRHRQKMSRMKKVSLVPPKTPIKHVSDVTQETRTNGVSRKPMEEHNEQLTNG